MQVQHGNPFKAGLPVAILGLLAAGFVASTQAAPIRVEVTLTNITKGQILSPAVVVTHTSQMQPLFALGTPASDELAAVAEDAVLDPLIASLSSDPAVTDVETLFGVNGPILPGETATVVLDAARGAVLGRVSLVGMLVTTNDAFYGVDGLSTPLISPFWLAQAQRVALAHAYDAGTEYNSEDCAYIPGPPCGNGGVRDTENAEGYVYIHSGIHGIGDLDPAEHDWLDPVARITVRIVRGSN